MSSDSQLPPSSRGDKSDAPLEPRKNNTEMDLWDLDDEIPSTPPPPKAQRPDLSTPSTPAPEDTPKISLTKPEIEPSISDSDFIETLTSNTNDPEEQETAPLELKSYLSSLSLVEKISIIAVVAILSLGATLSIIHFSNKIPIVPLIAKDLELPINGQRISVSSVETYWRKPITSGENADVVRRDAVLIPCLKITLNGSSSAIRVLFRDQDGRLTGDNISRNINGELTIELAATDGFKDSGSHAAYRAEDTGRWKVEVLEGTTEDAPMDQFQPLFETNISPDLR